MPSGQDYYAEMSDLEDALTEEVEALRKAGVQLAANERDYRVALRIRILEERSRGTPVTVIGDICRGEPEIADMKCARDCADAMYRASQERINVLKLQIRVLQSALDKEWATVPR